MPCLSGLDFPRRPLDKRPSSEMVRIFVKRSVVYRSVLELYFLSTTTVIPLKMNWEISSTCKISFFFSGMKWGTQRSKIDIINESIGSNTTQRRSLRNSWNQELLGHFYITVRCVPSDLIIHSSSTSSNKLFLEQKNYCFKAPIHCWEMFPNSVLTKVSLNMKTLRWLTRTITQQAGFWFSCLLTSWALASYG